MNKKLLIGVGVVVIVACAVGGWFFYTTMSTTASSTKEIIDAVQNKGVSNPDDYWKEEFSFQILAYNEISKKLQLISEGESIGSLKPLLKLPTSEILSQRVVNDGTLYFTIATKVPHMSAPPATRGWVGYVTDMTVAYRYYINTGELSALFNGYDIPGQYPFIKDISPDGNLVAYGLTGCYHCDGGQITTIIVNTTSTQLQHDKRIKDIGKTMNFSFTGPTSYRYAEALPNQDGLGSVEGPIHEGQY